MKRVVKSENDALLLFQRDYVFFFFFKFFGKWWFSFFIISSCNQITVLSLRKKSSQLKERKKSTLNSFCFGKSITYEFGRRIADHARIAELRLSRFDRARNFRVPGIRTLYSTNRDLTQTQGSSIISLLRELSEDWHIRYKIFSILQIFENTRFWYKMFGF